MANLLGDMDKSAAMKNA